MEDIAHLLNNGEVPELFSKEEKAKIVEEMESSDKNKDDGIFIFYFFLKKKNLFLEKYQRKD